MKKAIILAAGRGTRMKSDKFKVLHCIGGRPMILELLSSLQMGGIDEVALVVSPHMVSLQNDVGSVRFAVQEKALGTAHATLAARDLIGNFNGKVLIAFGDTPLIRSTTFQHMLDALDESDIVVLAFEPDDPAHYGRLVVDANGLQSIVEYKDANEKQRAIRLCNAGAIAVRAEHIWSLLSQIKNQNVAKEYYLFDMIEIGRKQGLKMNVVKGDKDEVMGVNSRSDLSVAERVFQQRKRQETMENGVTLQDPQTTYFSYDTQIESDVIVEPCVFFGKGVYVEKGSIIPAFSRLENIRVKAKK